ncbi:MAG TPA: TIGR03084 family metal-binding protein [Acidimicrobiia bacterium]
MVVLRELLEALDEETAALRGVLAPLDERRWNVPTPAPGWAVRDQVTHLAHFDDALTLALTDPDEFRVHREAAQRDVDGFTARVADEHRREAAAAVLAWWERARAALATAALAADPSVRVPWYGLDMSVNSAVTARVMETWAHGQDVYDACGLPHPITAAVPHVAFLGVRTFANSFLARGLAVPDAAPVVELVDSDGRWTVWGEDGRGERVRGPMVDFCLVVTQRRHIDDTALQVDGVVAHEWTSIAQAFAGPPGEGRRPTKKEKG